MRYVSVIGLFVLAACHNGTTEISRDVTHQFDVVEQMGRTDLADINAVAARIQPIARALCAQKNPGRSSAQCGFKVVVTGDLYDQPNAQHSLATDGSSVISVNRAMLANIENADELGFIIAHEAGHQIANHLDRLNGQTGTLGLAEEEPQPAFSLRSADIRALELEADALGAVVAYRAGFDPMVGAQALKRFMPDGAQDSSTHPALERRLRIVAATTQHLKSGKALKI